MRVARCPHVVADQDNFPGPEKVREVDGLISRIRSVVYGLKSKPAVTFTRLVVKPEFLRKRLCRIVVDLRPLLALEVLEIIPVISPPPLVTRIQIIRFRS